MGDAAENSIASLAMGDMAWATKMDKIHNMSIATGRWGHVATWVTKNGGLNVHNISIATGQWGTPQKQYRLSEVMGDTLWVTKMEDLTSTK